MHLYFWPLIVAKKIRLDNYDKQGTNFIIYVYKKSEHCYFISIVKPPTNLIGSFSPPYLRFSLIQTGMEKVCLCPGLQNVQKIAYFLK